MSGGYQGTLLSVCLVLLRSLSPSPAGAELGAGQRVVGRLRGGVELGDPVSRVGKREQKAQWRPVLQQQALQG